jgi:hypothetical protein
MDPNKCVGAAQCNPDPDPGSSQPSCAPLDSVSQQKHVHTVLLSKKRYQEIKSVLLDSFCSSAESRGDC